MSREGISLLVIQRQLGHAELAITSRYLRGIDNTEIIAAVHQRPAPMIPRRPADRPTPLRHTTRADAHDRTSARHASPLRPAREPTSMPKRRVTSPKR
jgi:hypothetical protein